MEQSLGLYSMAPCQVCMAENSAVYVIEGLV